MGKSEARQQLGWDPEAKIVLFNAGLDPRMKRRWLAEESFHLMRQHCPGATLVILEGDTDPDDMPRVLNAADCLLLTSRHEGSPNVVKEALACELPIVSVDVGDVAARVTGVDGCRIVPPIAADLASALLDTLERGRRSNGRERALQVSEPVIAGELAKVYEEMVR